MKRRRKKILAAVTIALTAGSLLLSGCGRTLPVIDAETLNKKKSVLVLVDSSVSAEAAAIIRQASTGKARAEQISMEIVDKPSTNTADLSSTINKNKYDSIIAIGNELLTPLAQLAEQTQDSQFVLLQDGLGNKMQGASPPPNVYRKLPDPNRPLTLWQDWVNMQRASGINVMYVSRTTQPLPADWVPSEEADRLLQLDIFPGDTWLPQLSYQISATKANSIALYTPVDETALSKIRSLKLPVTDMVLGLNTQYNWKKIVEDSIQQSLSTDWKSGEAYYTEDEMAITRK